MSDITLMYLLFTMPYLEVSLLPVPHRAFPQCKTEGIHGLPPMVIFVSKEGHYSILKSAATMGIGTNNVIAVKTDDM